MRSRPRRLPRPPAHSPKRRKRIRRRGARKPARVTHRTHPRKAKKPGRGTCTWCLKPILRPDGSQNMRRTFCDQVCVSAYLLRTDPKVMRQHIFVRDDGRCARCGTVWAYNSADWEADHVEPLREAYGDPRFWEPENLQILCNDPCHKDKTREDRARYGWGRRKPARKA